MYYLLLALSIAAAFLFFYHVLSPFNEPDFKLKGQLDIERLNFAVRELAVHSRRMKPRGKGLSIKALKKYIDRAYRQIAVRIRSGADVHSFEYWIYDNHYKFAAELNKLKSRINRFYFLPHTSDLPRVYELAQLIVKSCEGYVTEEILSGALEAYNAETTLTYAEIMAIKPALTFALIEFITIFCAKSLTIERKRKQAIKDIKKDRIDLSALSFNSYIHALSENCSDEVKRNVSALCFDNGIEVSDRLNNFDIMTASYNGRMQSAVTTLMKIEKICSDENILALSPVHSLLSAEPQIFYNNISLSTKFSYLYYLHRRAKKRKISEPAIAREAIEKSFAEKKDISFFILPPPKHKKFAYLLIAASLILTAGFCAGFAFFVGQYLIAASLISVPVFFALSGMIISAFCKSVFERRKLPSVDLKFTDKQNSRCLITTCRLIGKAEELDETFSNFETVICANPDSIFSYCLLLDLPTADSGDLSETDEKIISGIKTYYENSDFKDRIILLVRRRKQIKDGEKYQGWEKKRGALIDLSRLITNESGDDFYLKLGEAGGCKYIVTLDSDTLANCCGSLVALMEHPYNEGVVIMSVNMHTNSPEVNNTAFSKIFSGGAGLDSYSSFMADAEFDIFGSGNYTGKGIFRVKEFLAKAGNAFEDNRILSHDYIEGALSSCANSGETALDSFPKNYSQFLTRQVRWLRGDYQLLPFLKRKVKNGAGEKTKNEAAPIAKWHMFSNLVMPLAPVASIALLIFSLFINNPLLAASAAFLLPALHLLLSIRNSVLSLKNLWIGELIRQLFYIATLPVTAFYHLTAVIITLYRLIKKKKLLEWKVFAHSKGKVNFSPCYVAAIIFTSSAAVFNLSIFFYIISGLFLMGGVLNIILSRQIKTHKFNDNDFNIRLKEIFSKTYAYFTAQSVKENNYIPCDNFQETSGVGYVRRTSPTNIGFMLVSHICAFETGIITREKLIELCSNTVATIEKMPKYEGNLYNWTDIDTLRPLTPRYVSTVDSGNLVACLAMLIPYADEGLKKRLENLINGTRLEALFDYKRGLFRIGYNGDTGEFDSNHYDLAGSEASLTYLMAVGTGKIGCEAWHNLSRDAVKYGKRSSLVSWSGGMFEHLMTPLFFDYHRGTVYETSAKNVVKAQIRFSKKRSHKIFGISESQYLSSDNDGLYQYKAFGVPEIALSNCSAPSVVAPYAGMLALNADPKGALKNVNAMINFGLLGKFGLYEAADIEKGEIIRTYMSHHQGMILAAVCNYLKDGALIKSFKSLPQVRAAELLLTNSQPIKGKRKINVPAPRTVKAAQTVFAGGRHKIPYTNFLSAGRYSSVLTENGAGYAVFDKTLLTRFASRTDGQKLTAELNGKTFNLLDGKCSINPDSTIFENCYEDFSVSTEAFVLPSGSGEVRRAEIINKTDSPLHLKLSTYAEVVLNDKSADTAHPAFSNLFIRTENDTEDGFIYAERVNKVRPVFFAHYILPPKDVSVSYTTSRRNYYKRGKESSDFGAVLDPVFAGNFDVEIPPKTKIKFDVFYCASYNINALKNFVRLAKTNGYLERVRGSSFALGKCSQLSPSEKKSAAALLFGAGQSMRSVEFAHLLSPRPLVTLEVKNESSLPRLKNKLSAVKKLYGFLFEFNLAVVYTEKQGYFQHVSERINAVIDEIGLKGSLGAHCTLNLINSVMSPLEARFALNNSVDLEFMSFAALDENTPPPAAFKFAPAKMSEPQIVEKLGIGGYLDDGSYFVNLTNTDTPAPWSNIIANAQFGTLITESGGGFTYSRNSRQNKLTAFYNDTVKDTQSEFVVLGESGCLWSVTKRPVKADAQYYVTHSTGYTEFLCNYNGILASQKVYIDKNGETKYYDISLFNATDEHRNIDVMFAFEPVLGDFKCSTSHALRINCEENEISVFNPLNNTNLYAGASEPIRSWAVYREAFSDKNGAVTKNSLLKNTGSDLFPSMSVTLVLSPKNGESVVFTIGAVSKPQHADAKFVLADAKRYYSNLSYIRAADNNTAHSRLLKWLPYQTLCSRFFARAGFYQVGGATGFRDQLQDSLAVLHIDPGLVKEHIYKCAAHQFEAGDVQHWWHEPAVGVRTTCSDDRLFLPLAVAEYINFTGDYDILSERAPYLENVRLEPGSASAYTSANFTNRGGTILEHCMKAIFVSFDFGDNGLNKIRGGDWNDAMDDVGKRGEGTSVWLSMFLYYVIEKFLPFVSEFDDKCRLVDAMQALKEAIERAYDGEWYLRAYTDDGVKLGGADSPECKIDLLTQSWSALSGACGDKRVETALTCAKARLVDNENKIIKLFDPPFSKMREIGYITNYPEGVRENGGQYTHAAVWFIMALIKKGKTEEAWRLYNMLNPAEHSKTLNDAKTYALEPYVLAGDVYSGQHAGRGGWSFYTGSAAWYYKCLTEEFFGIKRNGSKIIVSPNLPESVENVSLKIKTNIAEFDLNIDNTKKSGEWRVIINNINYNSNEIILAKGVSGKIVVVKRV